MSNPYLDSALMKGLHQFSPKKNQEFVSAHKLDSKADNIPIEEAEKLKSRQEAILYKINELKSRFDKQKLRFRQEAVLKKIDDLQLEVNKIDHAQKQKLKKRQEAILNTIDALKIRLDEIQNPIINLSNFFVSNDYAPPIPFNWPTFPSLDKNTNISSLIRASCASLAENSRKFIDINYENIEKYARLLNKKEIDNLFVSSTWNYGQANEIILKNERDIINVSCYFIILQFGSGFRKVLHKYCDGRGASITIGLGLQNMFKKYKNMDCNSLNGITMNEISQLFEINYCESDQLRSLCDLIRKVIQETVNVLVSYKCNDFADYIYLKINESWIRHQTKISGTEIEKTIDVEFESSEFGLGLIIAPTKTTNIVQRTVVIDVLNKKNLDLKYCIVYKIDNEIVYDAPFEYIINKINTLKNDKNVNKIKISFGNNINTSPNTANYLVLSLVNDFSSLNDRYLYKNVFGDDLNIYLFKRAQLMVMDLYKDLSAKNKYFNFKDINDLCGPIDNVVPFVLMKDNVIKIKDKYKNEFEKYINCGDYVLKSSDLEVEIRGIALHALELILQQRKENDLNIASLTYYLWKKGKFEGYRQCERHYTRDTVFY